MWLTENNITESIKKYDFDIRKENNTGARWLDQKCTPDVLSIIADCICTYIDSKASKEWFSSLDIWHSEYTKDVVLSIFKKPSTEDKKAKNEYDKFFQQPMELLSYAHVLEKKKQSNKNFYKVLDKNALYFLSISERNSLNFLVFYINKVLSDSDLLGNFDSFFRNPDNTHYDDLKEKFAIFIKTYTRIKKDYEPNRIFTKVLNPLAYDKNLVGSAQGRMSKDVITYDMLMYNRNNFRDVYSSKPKGVTRKEYINKYKPNEKKYYSYASDKAKRYIKNFNDTFRSGTSEIDNTNGAVQIHHIFPESQFPSISGCYENLIALTPDQHLLKAHPNNKTATIDKEYQCVCLTHKLKSIRENLTSSEDKQEHIYSLKRFLKVLDIGLSTDDFERDESISYDALYEKIKSFYNN